MKEQTAHKTTPEHFEIFKAEARRFIDLFGLWDWRVDFRHEFSEDNLATCEHTTGCGKIATLALSTDWGDHEPTPEQVRQTAFHEVCHVLLADALDAACFMDLSPQQRHLHIDRAHHAIIRRLENVVLPFVEPLARGGMVTPPGYIVGERGPEVVNFKTVSNG